MPEKIKVLTPKVDCIGECDLPTNEQELIKQQEKTIKELRQSVDLLLKSNHEWSEKYYKLNLLVNSLIAVVKNIDVLREQE